jgi:acyl-CoA thioesterase I
MRMPLSSGTSRANLPTFGRLLALQILYLAFSVSAYTQTLIVAIDASNVAGKGVWPSQAWPAQLEGMLKAKGYNVQIKNAGKSGDTTSGMLHRLWLAVPSRTKIVILDMKGGYYNNYKKASATSQARGHADMEEIQARLKSRGIVIVPWARRPPAGFRQADGIHLTPEGHKLAAEQLVPRVIDVLKSLGG